MDDGQPAARGGAESYVGICRARIVAGSIRSGWRGIARPCGRGALPRRQLPDDFRQSVLKLALGSGMGPRAVRSPRGCAVNTLLSNHE
jgi:hypothetical protein